MSEKAYDFKRVKVRPHEIRTIELVDCFVMYELDSGIPGYPETRVERRVCTEKPFKPTYIDVAFECVPYFVVQQCYIGNRASWWVKEGGVSCEILVKRPAIKFPEVPVGLSVTLQVENKSDVPREFIARLVGEEL